MGLRYEAAARTVSQPFMAGTQGPLIFADFEPRWVGTVPLVLRTHHQNLPRREFVFWAVHTSCMEPHFGQWGIEVELGERESMRANRDDPDAVYFIDPPYTVAGRRLYAHSDIDHRELFRVASMLRGDFLMTYDDAEPIRELAAQFDFGVHVVLMKNTHHRINRELLIGRDLSWARAHPRELLQDPLFELTETDGQTCN